MKDVILVRGEVSKGVFQGCACLERFLGRGLGFVWVFRLGFEVVGSGFSGRS